MHQAADETIRVRVRDGALPSVERDPTMPGYTAGARDPENRTPWGDDGEVSVAEVHAEEVGVPGGDCVGHHREHMFATASDGELRMGAAPG
jgi:hypothetical protein